MDSGIENRTERLDKQIRRVCWILSIAAIAALLIVLPSYFLRFNGSLSNDHSMWGQFGDFVGGSLNPVFSFITLFAILFTLLIQSRELSVSSNALEEQSASLRTQSFENTFFSMLRMNLETKNTLDLEDTDEGKTVGRIVFRKVYGRFRKTYERVSQDWGEGQDEMIVCRDAYSQFFRKNQWYIGAYLRSLEEIFSFIDNRCPDDASEVSYWLIVRAQLSDFELLLLFYHCVCLDEATSCTALHSHDLFKFLPTDQLLDESLHLPFLNLGVVANGK